MNEMNDRSFLFAGGGTGGHIFPGLAIAEELAALAPDARSIFLCSLRDIDSRILTASAHPFVVIPAQPFRLRPIAAARLIWNWGQCVRTSRAVIRTERDAGRASTVVAMGGFVAPAVVQAARAERTPVTLVQLDASPGLANRWIAHRTDDVFTTYPKRPVCAPHATAGDPPSGWKPIPPIVRRQAVAQQPPAECHRLLALRDDRPTLVILGGSQGAGTINDAMIELARTTPRELAPWQIVHQAGGAHAPAGPHGSASAVERLREAYERAKVTARVEPFFDEIGIVWGAADLVIARAGAGTVAEAWANATPTLFLPYPFHRDGHQRLNAGPIIAAGGGELLTDHADAVSTSNEISRALHGLLPGGARLARMRAALQSLGPANGAAVIAAHLLSRELPSRPAPRRGHSHAPDSG